MLVSAVVVYANIAQIMWIAWINVSEKRILDASTVMIAGAIQATEQIIGNLIVINTRSHINMLTI